MLISAARTEVVLRQKILEHLRSLTRAARVDLIARKKSEASRLPERDADLPSRAPVTNDSLSRTEVERRRAALAAAQKAEAKRDAPAGNGKAPTSVPAATTRTPAGDTNDYDQDFVPESTVQDNVVELIAEMHELRAEVASLKTMLQAVFRRYNSSWTVSCNRGKIPGDGDFWASPDADEYDSLGTCRRQPICPACPTPSW